MILTLALRNLRRVRWLLASLLAGVMALEVLIVWIASNLGSTTLLLELLETMLPPAMRAFVTSQIGNLAFPGMVAFGFQHPVILTATLGFTIVLATVPAAERESGFLDLILARPVSRSAYLGGVILALVAGAIVLPLALVVGAGVGLAGVEVPDEIPWFHYLQSSFRLTALLLCVGGYTLLFTSYSRRRGAAAAQAVGLTLVFFWFNLTALMWVPLQRFRWLTPFDYFEPVEAATGARAPAIDPVVLLVVFALASAAAFRRFQRNDL